MRARYFQMVERIGVNTPEKPRAFGKRGEAMVMQTHYHVCRRCASSPGQRFTRGDLNRLYAKTTAGLGQQWRGPQHPRIRWLGANDEPFRNPEQRP